MQRYNQGETGRIGWRRRTAQAFRFLYLMTIGLALGGAAAECFTWLRTARFGGPYVFEVYRVLNIKLPHSAWPGMSKAILWILVQPVFLVGSVSLIALALILRMLEPLLRSSDQTDAFQLSPRQILLSPPLPPTTTDTTIAQIEEAYRHMDALKELSPSTPQGHDAM